MLSKFVKIVKKLSSKSEKKREEAMKELVGLEMDEVSLEHMEYLIEASTKVYQDDEDEFKDGSSAIMEFIANYEITSLVPKLTECFPRMSVWSRSITLTILTRLKTTESLKSLLFLLDEYIDDVPIMDFRIELTGSEKECANILFPELFQYIEYPNIGYTINRYIWLCLTKGSLQKEDVENETHLFLQVYKYFKKALITYQEKLDSKTMWSHTYLELRNTAGLILDIFGYLNPEAVEDELQEVLNFKDNRLRYFAVLSLLRLDKSIDQNIINEIAMDNEMRIFLYKALEDYGAEDKYPKQYLTQEAFAEAELVNWLIYPTELGHKPSKLECMEVITRFHEELGEVDYYLIRFKSEHEDWREIGWMAGVAGFYIKGHKPTIISHGYTFSLFEQWESKTPEQHLESIFEVLDQYWSSENK